MRDIVERLRRKQAFVRHGYAYEATLGIDPDCIEAADEIDRLRASAARPLDACVYPHCVGDCRPAATPLTEAKERGYQAARDNLREAWAAMAMIRETVETLAPSGSVKAAEHLMGPTFMHEADALVAGILATSVTRPDGGAT